MCVGARYLGVTRDTARTLASVGPAGALAERLDRSMRCIAVDHAASRIVVTPGVAGRVFQAIHLGSGCADAFRFDRHKTHCSVCAVAKSPVPPIEPLLYRSRHFLPNTDLSSPEFHDETKAREWLEMARWPTGAYCPHCGSFDVFRMEGQPDRRQKGTHAREGAFHCRDCRGQFTVLTGSVMESSHLPLAKWVAAIKLMTASKKGMSAKQISRMLDVTYKTAWFMCHRIREAMREAAPAPLGGEGKVVEADEMHHSKRETPAQLV